MATTFDVFFPGNVADLETTEGDRVAYDTSGVVGSMFGTVPNTVIVPVTRGVRDFSTSSDPAKAVHARQIPSVLQHPPSGRCGTLNWPAG